MGPLMSFFMAAYELDTFEIEVQTRRDDDGTLLGSMVIRTKSGSFEYLAAAPGHWAALAQAAEALEMACKEDEAMTGSWQSPAYLVEDPDDEESTDEPGT